MMDPAICIHTFVPLDVERLAEVVLAGDHADAEVSTVALDVAIIQAVRAGVVRAGRCTQCRILAFRDPGPNPHLS